MKKSFAHLSKVDAHDNFRTFYGKHIVIMLAYTESSALLYKREGKKPASVITRGGDEFDAISAKSLISIREISVLDFEIIVSASSSDCVKRIF